MRNTANTSLKRDYWLSEMQCIQYRRGPGEPVLDTSENRNRTAEMTVETGERKRSLLNEGNPKDILTAASKFNIENMIPASSYKNHD
jgi:hypothetical protein